MSYQMTQQEREDFLAAPRVGVLSLHEEGHGPLAVPVWYAYQTGGGLWFLTGRASRKGRLLTKGTRISLCVQTEDRPYKYVSVEGPVTDISATDTERDLRPMARRYLGDEGGDRYTETAAGEDRDGSVRVAMRLDRWLSVDYSKRA